MELTDFSPTLNDNPTTDGLHWTRVATVEDGDRFADLLAHLSPHNRRLFEDLVDQLLAAQGQEYPHQPLHYQEHIEAWISTLLGQGRSLATIRRYRAAVLGLLRTIPEPTKVLIDAYLAVQHGTGLSASYFNLQIAAFKSFFGYLVEAAILRSNPAERLKAVPIPHRERAIPHAEHIRKLLRASAIKPKDRAMILLMVDCGLRVGELCTIRLADLSPERCEVTVIGKGNKQRSVPLSPATWQAIVDYRASRPALGTHLFPKRDRDIPVNVRVVEERMVYLCQKAGVPKIVPHQFRHFFASSMLNQGANLRVVSQLLGHADTSTTANIYWHILEADEKRRTHQDFNPLKGIIDGQEQH